jgi:hypothetical protein
MRRRVHGGLDIIPLKNSEFKYTIDPQRILWTKNVYPISGYLLQLLQSIPWNSYRFEGDVKLWTDNTVNSNKEYSEAVLEEDVSAVSHDVRITATTDGITPYLYFGGGAYEILNTRYKAMTNLRNFVDPTGDIDVAICLPKITPDTKIAGKDYYDYHFNNLKVGNNTSGLIMSDLLDTYTRWIFNEFEKKISGIHEALFAQLFANTIEFDFKEAEEGTVDISKKVGHIWIVRSINIPVNMIKIQLICKFKDMEKADHLIEFVLYVDKTPTPMHYLNDSIKNISDEMQMFDSYPLINFVKMIRGNIDTSLENRIKFWNTCIRHKFYNHVGRIQYLNDLLPRLIKRPDDTVANSVGKIKIGDGQYYTLISFIMKLIELLIKVKTRGDICRYDYKYIDGSCNQKEIIDRLVGGLSTMIFKQKPPSTKIPYISTSLKVNGKGRLDPIDALKVLYTLPSVANSRTATATKGGKRGRTRHNIRRRHRMSRTRKARKRI